jgi:hypothetical protein
VWGEEIFFDATKVEANASIDSRRSRSLVGDRLEEHLAGVFPEDAPPANDDEHSGVIAGFVGPEDDERRALARTNALGHRHVNCRQSGFHEVRLSPILRSPHPALPRSNTYYGRP